MTTLTAGARTPRAALSVDDAAVTALLGGLSRLYPDADRWLRNRLAQAHAGQAAVLVAESGGDTVGVAITMPKAAGVKLCTLHVRPDHRGVGHGRALAGAVVRSWRADGVGRGWVTVASPRVPDLLTVLGPLGFTVGHEVRDRYGVGRHETVLHWAADTA